MSNHLHFLIQVGVDPLARPMRKIAAEFARAMQAKLNTTGHFFERRYHATLIEATDYLFTVLRYIHRNPMAAGVSENLDGYPWSSHHAYMGRRHEPWLCTSFILEKFASEAREATRAYAEFIAFDSADSSSPFPEDAFIFGSDEYVERIRGIGRRERSKQKLQELIDEACGRFEVEREQVDSQVRNQYLTKVRAWIAHQAVSRGVANRSEVARALSRSEGTLRAAILRYPNELD